MSLGKGPDWKKLITLQGKDALDTCLNRIIAGCLALLLAYQGCVSLNKPANKKSATEAAAISAPEKVNAQPTKIPE